MSNEYPKPDEDTSSNTEMGMIVPLKTLNEDEGVDDDDDEVGDDEVYP